MTDLLGLTAELIGISSLSGEEAPIADFVESRLRSAPHLEVIRIKNNVIAKTNGNAASRVIVAGHLDTVSSLAGLGRKVGDEIWGLGASDMKGTLAVMLSLATETTPASHDVTWIFYAKEEIARSESGLHEISAEDVSLLQGDVAILGEPTGGAVEAGCQGTLRIKVTLKGVSAHAARPYMGRNALRRLNDFLSLVAAAQPRSVALDGVIYVEQLEPVGVSGGSGGNVIPETAELVLNHRFAPDRSPEQAIEWVRSLIEPVLEEGDVIEILDVAPGALPGLTHPILQELVENSQRPVVAKVGWTDVATFTELGVPAANFGAGDPELAHHADERVSESQLEHARRVLKAVLWSA